MCNFRETDDRKKDCTSCKYFISYADIYEDDLEPYDLGRCSENVSEMVGSEYICDLLEEQIEWHDKGVRESNGMLCTFCEKEIIETELTYTEDAEPSHINCLEDFNKHWGDKAEMMDLMGY